MNWRQKIITDPDVLVGKPVIKGTRLSVEFLLDLFANGWTENQILENYPQLKHEDLIALFCYIKDFLADSEDAVLDRNV